MTKLPEWLLKELPEVNEPASIFFKDGQYFAVHPNGEEASFETVDEAYDYIHEKWGLEVVFSETLPEYEGIVSDMMIWGKQSSDGGTRALFSRPDHKKLKSLERDYENFLKLDAEYKNNPQDFRTVYKFVDTHPAFWNRPNKEDPWHWMTYGHCSQHRGQLALETFFNDDGTHYWRIETGQHVEPEYNERYHDYRLDSRGSTVEEAYIHLAHNIFKFFNNDGSKKEDVPHEKPEWVLDIENYFEAKK